MIVDDDAEMRTLLAEYFRRLGFEVAEKENGAAALQAVTNDRFDCFILDVAMPEMLAERKFARRILSATLANLVRSRCSPRYAFTMLWLASASWAVSVKCLLPSRDSRANLRRDLPKRMVNPATGGASSKEPSVSRQLT